MGWITTQWLNHPYIPACVTKPTLHKAWSAVILRAAKRRDAPGAQPTAEVASPDNTASAGQHRRRVETSTEASTLGTQTPREVIKQINFKHEFSLRVFF